MRKLAAIIIGFMAVLIGTWWITDTLFNAPTFAVSFTQITGILSISLMGFATLLAIRPLWIEPFLGGLDKMYWLHKWMSIGSLPISIVHWLTAASPNGHHGQPAALATPVAAQTAITFLRSLEGPAKSVAQPALWILLALVAVALIKKIPYHIFALTHRLMPLVFAVLVFHSVVFMKPAYWSQPIGWLMALVFIFSIVAAAISIFQLIGAGRKVKATVIAKTAFPDMKTLLVELKMQNGWKGHKPGQFAFVGSPKRWSKHPFTIASHWDDKSRTISFIVKELGDATQDLDKKLAIGTELVVEGPYGRFNFDDRKVRQIWISGGVGVTPFVAQMKSRAAQGDTKPINHFHSDPIYSEKAHGMMQTDATNSNVSLHLFITPKDGRLTAAKIRATVPDWKNASIWFCGPTAFAAALKLDFVRHGLATSDFHHERFEMR